MYGVMELPNGRGLWRSKSCRKFFTSGGKLVEFDKDGLAVLPKGAKISVNKFLWFHYDVVRTTQIIRSNYRNAMIEKYNLGGEPMTVDEEEIILCSLECEKNI